MRNFSYWCIWLLGAWNMCSLFTWNWKQLLLKLFHEKNVGIFFWIHVRGSLALEGLTTAALSIQCVFFLWGYTVQYIVLLKLKHLIDVCTCLLDVCCTVLSFSLKNTVFCQLYACRVCRMTIGSVHRNHCKGFSELYGQQNRVFERSVLHNRPLHDNDYSSSDIQVVFCWM